MPSMEVAAVVLFALALVHTFATKFFERLAHRGGNHTGLRHLLGEVEVVFGFWAVVLIATMAAIEGGLARSSPRRSQTYEWPTTRHAAATVESAAWTADRSPCTGGCDEIA